jgi:hypothetical protein
MSLRDTTTEQSVVTLISNAIFEQIVRLKNITILNVFVLSVKHSGEELIYHDEKTWGDRRAVDKGIQSGRVMFVFRIICSTIKQSILSELTLANITDLQTAVVTLVGNGDSVALEGFTHLIPMAVSHEIIRQKKRNLTLIRMTPGLIYDQIIGMGCPQENGLFLGGGEFRC